MPDSIQIFFKKMNAAIIYLYALKNVAVVLLL